MPEEPENERYLKYLAPLTYNSSLNVIEKNFYSDCFYLAGNPHRLAACSRSNEHYFQCLLPDQFPEIIPVEKLYGPFHSMPVKRCLQITDSSFDFQLPPSKRARQSSQSIAENKTYNFLTYCQMSFNSQGFKQILKEKKSKKSDTCRLSTVFLNSQTGVLDLKDQNTIPVYFYAV